MLSLVLLVGMLVMAGNVWGQTTGDYRSNATNNFTWTSTTAWQRYNGSTWGNDGTYPGQNAGAGNVTITGGLTCTIGASVPNAIGSLVVGNGTTGTTLRFERNLTLSLEINGNLSVSANSSFSIRTRNNGTPVNSLTIGGNILNNGTLNMTNSTYSSTVYLDGTNQTISGSNTPTFRDLSISGNGTTTLIRNISITGNLNVETGAALDLSTFTANRSTPGGTLTVAGTLLVGGTSNFPASYSVFTNANGTVNYDNNGAQTIAAKVYNNLTFSGSGAKSITTGTSVSGNLSIAPTGAATASIAAGLSVSVGSLTLGGIDRDCGTWGSNSSSATNKTNTYFATTTGYLIVGSSPTVYSVTGGGSYCEGGSGVAIRLSDSESGVNYQLYLDESTPVGSPVAGTGSAISFGNQTSAGTYTVVATGTIGGCTSTMSGNKSVTINPLPAAAGAITGSSSVVQGQSNVSYSVGAISDATSYVWSYSGTGATITGTTNNITISFASNATSGNLTVYGVNSCGDGTMSANFPISISAPEIPSVTLGVDNTTIAENGGISTVTATLSNSYNQDVIIYIGYFGTASHPNDYQEPAFYSVTIPEGSLTGTVTITSTDDCSVEGDETVIVNISSVTNGTENGNQEVTTTIIDDDIYPTITLSANNLSIPEKDGTATITVGLSNAFCQDITINLNYLGTALHPNDYPDPSSYAITIPAHSSSKTLILSTTNDYLVEGDETVIIGVSSTNITGISTAVNPVTVTIKDDDSYSITVSPTSGLSTTESGGSTTFTVVLNALTYNDVSIDLVSNNLAEGTVSPSRLTFTNANFYIPQTVTVTGVDDGNVDGNTLYTITTSTAVSYDLNFNELNPDDVIVTNIDNDGSTNNFWLRADAGITGNVTIWTDQSGNGINGTNTGNAVKVDNSINFNPSLSLVAVDRQFTLSGTHSFKTFIIINKTPNTNSDLAGLIGADGDKGVRLTNDVNELTPYITPHESWRGDNNADDWVNTTGGTAKINGVTDANMLHSSKWHIANLSRDQSLLGNYFIGGYFAGRSYTGNIAEIMGFDNDPSNSNIIETYLAIKYGITLGGPTSVVDYVNSSGEVIWQGNSTYQNDIAGLGKGSIWGLDQKVSTSINVPAGTSARTVMATDNDFVSSNLSGRTSLSEGQYLIWGHNNASVSTLVSDGSVNKVDRLWRVQNTNVPVTVNLQIDLTGFPTPLSDLDLFIDNDDNFSNGGTSIIELTHSTGNLYQASINFPLGISYFSIGKCVQPTVTVNSPVVCAGINETITATPFPDGAYSYLWTVPTGATDPGNVSSFSTNVAGTYSVLITNIIGCQGTGSGTLTENPLPSISGTTSICMGSTSQLNGSGNPAISDAWSSSNQLVATVSSSGLVTSVGIGNCQISYTNEIGCSTHVTVTITELPEITLNPSPLNLCSGSIGTFSVATTAISPNYQWQYSTDQVTWTNTNGIAGVSGHNSNVLTITNPPLSYSGNYLRCVVTSGTCSVNSSSALLTVNVQPAAPTPNNITITYDGTVHAATATPPDGATIVWYDASTGGNVISNLSASQRGVYTAWAESQNITSGCSSATRTMVTLTINPSAITITADVKSKVYGSTDPELTYKITSGSVVMGDLASGVLNRALGESVGNYVISKNTLTFGSNYTETFVEANLTITQALLTVTADNKTKVYDESVYSAFTVTYNGFTNGDNSSALNGTLSFSGNATTAKNVGTGYTITPGGLTSSNYSISFLDGTLEITRATLVPNISANDKCYDGTILATLSSKTLSGVILSDIVTLEAGVVSFSSSTAGTGKIVTASGLYLSGADAGNYSLSATTATTIATINALPTIVLGTNPSVCSGASTANLHYSSTAGSPNRYNVDFDSDANNAGFADISNAVLSGSNITFTLPNGVASGTYNGALTVKNNITGCESIVYPVSITINPNLPVSVSIAASSNPSCDGSEVTFTASPVNGGTAPEYQWKVNGNDVGTNTSTYAFAPKNGDVVICVLSSDATCATGTPATSNTITMTVNELTANPVFTAGATIVCQDDANETYIATAAHSVSITYSVLPAGAGTINSVTGEMDWAASFYGTATITATATGLCNVKTVNRTVTVNPLPTPASITTD